MKSTSLVATLLALAITTSVASAAPITLIGGAVRNGDLNDLSGATATIGGMSGQAVPLTQVDGSRVAFGSDSLGGAAGNSIDINFWSARRPVALMGGNGFYGFDDGTGTPLGGNPNSADRAFVYNNGEEAGTVDLIHDQFAVGSASLPGAVFTLSYQLATDDADSDVESTPLLSIAGGAALTPDSITLANLTGTGSEDDVSVLLSGDDSVVDVTVVYTLAGALAATDTIDLTLDNAQQVDSVDVDRAAIDNIVLTVEVVAVPEPGAGLLALMGLTFAGAAGTRRRLG